MTGYARPRQGRPASSSHVQGGVVDAGVGMVGLEVLTAVVRPAGGVVACGALRGCTRAAIVGITRSTASTAAAALVVAAGVTRCEHGM